MKNTGKWVVLLAFCAVAAAMWFIASGAYWPRLTRGTASYETYFRIKANYTYKGKNGPEPWVFDVVAGCGVSLTQYATGQVAGISQRVPTLYALPTSDGAALMIEVVKACGGQTTENGKVPKDFFPAIVYYEKADDLSLGMLYVSEDAYERPLSKLAFHGATISAATKEEYQHWNETDGKKNLISFLSSPEVSIIGNDLPFRVTPELIENPRLYWKASMPKNCYGVARLKMPEKLRQYVRQFWKPDGPRYWSFEVSKATEFRNWLSNDQVVTPLSGVLFDGQPWGVYNMWSSAERNGWATGLVTRDAGGSFAFLYPNSKYPSALPADYFPVKHSEGIPWLMTINPNTKFFAREAEIADESKKGIFYCFGAGLPEAVSRRYLPNFNTLTQSGTFPSEMFVDGQMVPEVINYGPLENGGVFFDRDEYLLWMEDILL